MRKVCLYDLIFASWKWIQFDLQRKSCISQIKLIWLQMEQTVQKWNSQDEMFSGSSDMSFVIMICEHSNLSYSHGSWMFVCICVFPTGLSKVLPSFMCSGLLLCNIKWSVSTFTLTRSSFSFWCIASFFSACILDTWMEACMCELASLRHALHSAALAKCAEELKCLYEEQRHEIFGMSRRLEWEGECAYETLLCELVKTHCSAKELH